MALDPAFFSNLFHMVDPLLLYVLLAVLGNFIVIYIFSMVKDDNSYVDVAWGLGFILAAVVSFFLGTGQISFNPSLLLTSLVLVWGTRLSYHLGKRVLKMSEEDYRYQEMRDKWDNFYISSFFKVYLLQAAILMVVVSPVIYVNLSGFNVFQLYPVLVLGLLVWVTGFFFETVGDHQLKKFKEEGGEGVLDTGLWRYTRHPNYFGESLVWWGVFLIAVSASGTLFSLLTVASPLLITFLLLKVSGVPLLEEELMKDEEYRNYAERTSKFVPWFPREEKDS